MPIEHKQKTVTRGGWIYRLKIDNKKWEEIYQGYKKTILLFVTGNCNLQCSYCFNIHNLTNNQEMTLDYIKKIVENNPGVGKYDIQGGEPMLHSRINEIISYLNSKNKIVGLYTNGYFLSKLEPNHKKLKICVSFQSLAAEDKSLRPITDVTENIKKFQNIYPIKLVFLLNRHNYKILNKVVEYVENEFKAIDKLTIGLIRNEVDYWNDNFNYVLPLKKYCDLIQKLIQDYDGRLSLDIFTKGVLRTSKLPKKQKNQICRFKNVFFNKTYVPCLYLIASDRKVGLDENLKVPFFEAIKCKRTGRGNCLADKIYLKKIKNAKE